MIAFEYGGTFAPMRRSIQPHTAQLHGRVRPAASAVGAAFGLSWVLMACVAPPTSAPSPARAPEPAAAPGAPALLRLQITFEPPLLTPARLAYAHESGRRGELRTDCTGVALELPPGPVHLRLVVGERSYERVLRVDAAPAPVIWSLAP